MAPYFAQISVPFILFFFPHPSRWPGNAREGDTRCPGGYGGGGIGLRCQIPGLCIPVDPAEQRGAGRVHANSQGADAPRQRWRLCHHGDVQKGGEPEKAKEMPPGCRMPTALVAATLTPHSSGSR